MVFIWLYGISQIQKKSKQVTHHMLTNSIHAPKVMYSSQRLFFVFPVYWDGSNWVQLRLWIGSTLKSCASFHQSFTLAQLSPLAQPSSTLKPQEVGIWRSKHVKECIITLQAVTMNSLRPSYHPCSKSGSFVFIDPRMKRQAFSEAVKKTWMSQAQ